MITEFCEPPRSTGSSAVDRKIRKNYDEHHTFVMWVRFFDKLYVTPYPNIPGMVL